MHVNRPYLNPHKEGGTPKMIQYKWTCFEGKLDVMLLTLPSLYCFGNKQRGISEEICNLYQNFQ